MDTDKIKIYGARVKVGDGREHVLVRAKQGAVIVDTE